MRSLQALAEEIDRLTEAIHGEVAVDELHSIEPLRRAASAIVLAADGADGERGDARWERVHRLRNPIAALLGYRELAAEEIADPGVQAQLQAVKETAERMLDVLDRVG